MLASRKRGISLVQQVTYAAQDQQKTKQYYITLHPGTFPTKDSFELGKITNWFKRNGRSKQHTLAEIFELCTQGKCFIPSHIELDEEGANYSFVSSKLMFIDVDDDEMLTEPQQILDKLSEVCAGLFFTPSHGIKGNRYRLVFVLDDYVRTVYEYKAIFKVLASQLESIGLPIDKAADNPLQRMRTGTVGYIISNIDAVYPVTKAKAEIQRMAEEQMKERAKKFEEKIDRGFNRIYSFEELKARAEVIGYVEDREEWQNLGYALWSYIREGYIDEIDGFEIFTILCGGNDESYRWKTFSKPNEITIGTFIGYSNKAGFKDNYKYYHAIGDAASSLEVKRVKYEKHIPAEYSKSLLAEEKKILVKSPTGSGKTHSFVTGAKELAEELRQQNRTRFFIFAVPTIAICDQVAHDQDILAVRGQHDKPKKASKKTGIEMKENGGFIIHYDELSEFDDSIYHKLTNYYFEGKRVIVCTYDMAEVVHDMLEKIHPFASFGLIVDEYHQFTTAYGYRHKAIESLHALVDNVKSFVALSGTPEDILRDPFDYEVHVSTKYEKAPCQVWGAITYSNKEDEEPMLFELIKKKVQSSKKLLVFIQSKEMIKRLKTMLDSVGINTAAVISDGKKDNPTYLSLVNEARFPSGVDVILTTSVLSDGININNESNNYECILVASATSPLFDVAQTRQCANRFRNLYQSFIIYTQTAKRHSDHLYNIENSYNYERRLASNVVEILNSEFEGKDNYKLMRMGLLEKRYGVKLDDNFKAYYNPLNVRYNVSKEKAIFYRLYRNEYITALKKLMGFEPASTISISEALEVEGVDLSEIAEEIEELKDAAKLSNQEKRERIGLHFTKAVYDAFKEENDEVLNIFRRAVTSEHYSCLKGIVGFTDYQTCLKVVKGVTRRADAHKFRNQLEGYVNGQYYKSINRGNGTYKVFHTLAEHLNELFECKDDFEAMLKDVTKKTRVGKKVDVKKISETYFYIERTRTERSRGMTLKELTLKRFADKYELSEFELLKTIRQYAEMEGGKIAQIIIKKQA